MTMNRTRQWVAAFVCAVSMIPAAGAAQNQTRSIGRVSDRPAWAPLVNLYWQQESRTRLGLYLNADQSRRYDRDGALVTGVMRDSPAEEAGLEEGDVITEFEGRVLTIPLPDDDLEQDFDLDESLPAQRLLALARDLEEGQTVEIQYLRDGSYTTVSVVAEEFEFPEVRTFGSGQGLFWRSGQDGNGSDFRVYDNLRGLNDRLRVLGDRLGDVDYGDLTGRLNVLGDRLEGIQIRTPSAFNFSFGVTSTEGVEFIDLNPELGEYFGTDTGVLVVEVDEESTLGLMAGDVVLAVGARDAETVGRVLRLIRSYEEDEPIRFTIIRQGSEMVAEGFLR